ncbi:MAG TPA: hypothetical protein VIM14_02085 [Polyangia bacterium]
MPRTAALLFVARLGALCVAPASCANGGPVIPDATDRISPPSAREGADANDVFMRKPWEVWRISGENAGIARFHREAFMLLPDRRDSFRVGDIAVFAADGSDVRLDYATIDMGTGSQSRESISVFVYRAPGPLEDEWKSIVDRTRRKHPGATVADPFPPPGKHPPDLKQMALVAPRDSGDQSSATFVQVALFHQGAWAVRYEIDCPFVDVPVARTQTLAFLRSLRARE